MARPKKESAGRVFTGQKKIFHDLYKLSVAKMLKNMSWQPIPADEYTPIEHCHFFHTVDSSGKTQIYSTSVGGHFHIMEIEDQGDGNPPLVKCVSGPMKLARVKDPHTLKYVKKPVPVNDVDSHTHEVTYLKSDEIALRKLSDEAAKVIGANANLTAKPAGLDVK